MIGYHNLIGNGLLVMIDEKTKIGNFFKKDEIVTYKIYQIYQKKLLNIQMIIMRDQK